MGEFVHVRDYLEIGPALNDLISAESVAGHISPGDTLIFLARECRQGQTWQVPYGYPVVIVADTYRTTAGWSMTQPQAAPVVGISVDARTAGTTGGGGTHGEDGIGTVSHSSPGGDGGHGWIGTPGQPGGMVTLFAQTIFPVMLSATGTRGGDGGPGGNGGDGVKYREIPHAGTEIHATNGGNGGAGGAGAAGGAGGSVTCVYTAAGRARDPRNRLPGSVPLQFPAAWVAAGLGGNGGAGGSPGKSFGEDGEPFAGEPHPVRGADGAKAADGAAGHLNVTTSTTDDFWQRVTSLLPSSALAQWSEHRLRMGRYRFRSFNQGDPARNNFLRLAIDEFEAVKRIGSAEDKEQATGLLDAIWSGLNAVGLPRDASVKPDFDTFEQTYVEYTELLGPLFNTMTTLISNAVALEAIDNQLTANEEVTHRALPALEARSKAADDDQSVAASDKVRIDSQIAAVQAQIQRLNAELTDARIQLPGAEIELTGTALLGGIFEAIPVMKYVKMAVGVLAKITADPSSDTQSALLGQPVDDSVLGGLGEMVHLFGEMFGLVKSTKDILNAVIAGDEQKVKELTSTVLTLVYQQKRQLSEVEAAQKRAEAARYEVAAAQADEATLQAAIGMDVADLARVASIVEYLLASIDRLGERVVRNVFLAARALDILMFNDAVAMTAVPPGSPPVPGGGPSAKNLYLDFGVVHPDIVADALQELRRGGVGADRLSSAAKALQLTTRLANQYAQAPGWITYRDAANELSQKLSSSDAWIVITDPATLASLKLTGVALIRVGLPDLPAAACEIRISRFAVVLRGATTIANVPSVVGQVTYGGLASARRRDGVELLIDGPAITDLVTVHVDPTRTAAMPSLATGTTPTFYGRSPAAVWQLDLRQPMTQGLQLDNLDELRLGMQILGVPTPAGPVAFDAQLTVNLAVEFLVQ
jgi:hypothetical protein